MTEAAAGPSCDCPSAGKIHTAACNDAASPLPEGRADGRAGTLTVDLIARMWRDHVACNWLSDGINVRWTCGIIHPGPIHMQPTTRDRHLAALIVTQVGAEITMAVADAQRRADLLIAAERERRCDGCGHDEWHHEGHGCYWVGPVDRYRRPGCSCTGWLEPGTLTAPAVPVVHPAEESFELADLISPDKQRSDAAFQAALTDPAPAVPVGVPLSYSGRTERATKAGAAAARDALTAALGCRHCGKQPDADGDHSCPCPNGDDCPDHPVGVQPTAEAATSATDRAVPTRPEPAEERCEVCGATLANHRWTRHPFSPAVPVVHPEPGDRAALRWHTWSAIIDNPDDYGNRRLNAALGQADAEVAAAVAAVRADLAAKVEEALLGTDWEPDPTKFASKHRNHNRNADSRCAVCVGDVDRIAAAIRKAIAS